MLRVARFAARFGFAVAPETDAADARARRVRRARRRSSPERVWQELARGSRWSRIRRGCSRCCANAARSPQLLPEVDALFGVPQRARTANRSSTPASHVARALDYAAGREFALPVRYAVLAHRLRRGRDRRSRGRRHSRHAATTCARRAYLRAAAACPSTAATPRASRRAGIAHRAARATLRAGGVLDLLNAADALRRPERLDALLRGVRMRRAVAAGARRRFRAGVTSSRGARRREGGRRRRDRACRVRQEPAPRQRRDRRR